MNIFKRTGTPQDSNASAQSVSIQDNLKPAENPTPAAAAKGTFIVIEGTDGSGKGTQFRLLSEKLERLGYDIATFDFPRYDEPSSYFVREYLNGNYGSADAVGPYVGSLFYALDRYAAALNIREALDQGKIVLANRYVGSNMAHQGTKLPHPEQRRGYFIWLDNLEFEMLKVPRPDLNLVLRMPAEIAQSLVDQKTHTYTDKKRDLHEADLTHLKHALEVYDDLCQLFPKDFQRIDCVRDGQLLALEDVQKLVWEKISPWLPTAPAAPANMPTTETSAATPTDRAYVVPEQLDDETRSAYIRSMDEMLAIYGDIERQLDAYVDGHEIRATEAAEALRTVLPIATTAQAQSIANSTDTQEGMLGSSAKTHALHAYGSEEPLAIQLTDVWPRNELSLVADVLYGHSTVSLKRVRQAADEMTYDQKQRILNEVLRAKQDAAAILSKSHYTWDILSDVVTFQSLLPHMSAIVRQALTPLSGYAVPQIIEDAGLVDAFESCFDASLSLYSQLQQAYPEAAQLATLQGHKVRWTAVSDGQQLQLLAAAPPDGLAVKQVLDHMREQVYQTHPLLAESLAP